MDSQPNHLKIWLVAAAIGIPVSWVLRWLLSFLIYRFGFFYIPYFLLWVLLWVASTVVAAVIMYRRQAFSEPSSTLGAQMPAGMGSTGMGLTAGAVPTPSVSTSSDNLPEAIPTVLVYDRLHCTGELYLANGELLFVCLKSQSAVKANAGRAVAHQFGLLGALIHAIASSAGEKKRIEALQATKAEIAHLPIAEQIQRQPQSFALTKDQITRFKTGFWSGTYFEAGGKRYVFPTPPKPFFGQITQWCSVNGVNAEGFR